MRNWGIGAAVMAFALAGCSAPEAAVEPGPTVTVTEQANPEPSPSPTSQPADVDLSKYIYITCTAATQHAILWAIADSVYFEEDISGLARLNTEWYLDVLNEGSQMSGEVDGLPAETAAIVNQVAEDLEDQAMFVREMKRTDDYYVWYDTWMSMVDDPAQMESVRDLLSAADLATCPLYPEASIFGL